MFKQGPNSFFEDWKLSDVKTLMSNALSDTPNIPPCKSGEDTETIIPEQYNWREQYPNCAQPVQNQGNCSAAYAVAVTSAVADRICTQSGTPIRLSAQEVIDCDGANYGCNGGYATKALNWGKRKGFVEEKCLPYNNTVGECEDYTQNECRINEQVYKVIDYCLAMDQEGIKKEILKNGPVVSSMQMFTDFLVYKEGLYHRSEDAFKFNGQHVVKIVGWDQAAEGQEAWIVENSWGSDWGENGFVRMLTADRNVQVDFYALGNAAYPMTMEQLYRMQAEMGQSQQQEEIEEGGEVIDMDLTTQ